MKKSLIFFFTILAFGLNSQNEIYTKTKIALGSYHPNLTTDSKLLFVQFNTEKELSNNLLIEEIEKAATIYENAKLSGGKLGIVCLLVSKNTQEEIALNKLAIKKSLIAQEDGMAMHPPSGVSNILFNSKGEIVSKNISPDKIYQTVSKLITR